MWLLSVQNGTRVFVDSINIFSPKEKRHTKNEIETGTREAVQGERWQIMQTPCKQKARVFSSSSSPSHCMCLRERWGQPGIGDIEQTKGGGVVGHPRKDCIRKVVFTLLFSRRLFSTEFVHTSPYKRGVKTAKPQALPLAPSPFGII